MGIAELVILAGVGLFAGISNAIVGGGTLFTFPVMLAVGLPPVVANTTCTVALWPGTVTSARAYLPVLRRAPEHLPPRVGVAVVGGLIGAVLLLASGDALFFRLVPWLLAIATFLFTFSRPLVRRFARAAHGQKSGALLLTMEFFCAIYGGYFGAAIGILLLAAMALAGEQDMQLANAQRNFLVCFINGIAMVLFVARGVLDWPVALVVMAGAIVGGYIGARIARLIPNEPLRHIVTAAGVVFSVIYFVRAYS